MGALLSGLMFVVNFFGGPVTFVLFFAVIGAAISLCFAKFYRGASYTPGVVGHDSTEKETSAAPSIRKIAGTTDALDHDSNIC